MTDEQRQELAAIQKRAGGGYLPPALLVDSAKNPNSPWHGEFEWDDSKAGHQYRIEQARRIIRAYVTITPNLHGKTIQTRIFTSLPSDRIDGRGYRETSVLIRDVDAVAEMRRELMKEIGRLRVRFGAFAQLVPILDAVEKAAMLADRKPVAVSGGGRGVKKRAA